MPEVDSDAPYFVNEQVTYACIDGFQPTANVISCTCHEISSVDFAVWGCIPNSLADACQPVSTLSKNRIIHFGKFFVIFGRRKPFFFLANLRVFFNKRPKTLQLRSD